MMVLWSGLDLDFPGMSETMTVCRLEPILEILPDSNLDRNVEKRVKYIQPSICFGFHTGRTGHLVVAAELFQTAGIA